MTNRSPTGVTYGQTNTATTVTLAVHARRGLTISVTQSAFATTERSAALLQRMCQSRWGPHPSRAIGLFVPYRPCFSLRSASRAPCQPGESVMTHLTHSGLSLTERVDESTKATSKLRPPRPTADSPLLRMRGRFGRKAINILDTLRDWKRNHVPRKVTFPSVCSAPA